jgi:actin-related protein
MLKRVMKLDENNLQFGKLKDYMLNVTFPVFSPWKLREKIIEVMFEYYGFGGFYPVTGPEMI